LECEGCGSLAFVSVCGRVCGGGKRQWAAAGRAKNVTQKNNGREGGGRDNENSLQKRRLLKFVWIQINYFFFFKRK